MRNLLPFAVIVTLVVLARPSRADDVPLLDGQTMHGRIVRMTADTLELEGDASGGGTFQMTVSADHVDPHWWWSHRDAAIGNDAQARLDLALWATEHGLFRQAKDEFEKARQLDAKLAAGFQDRVLPHVRAGIAADLVASAGRAMEADKLATARKLLHAVLTRFGDTPAAADARTLLPTVQHRMDAHLKELAHWKQFADDEAAREASDRRREVTDPIVALIRQGHNVMGNLPPMAAQANAVDMTREAGVQYQEALRKIDEARKAHAGDRELIARLDALQAEAQSGLVQSHVTAGNVYTATGDYQGAAGEVKALRGLDPAEAHALESTVAESQSWSDDGIFYDARSRRLAR